MIVDLPPALSEDGEFSTLDSHTFGAAVDILVENDPALAGVVQRYGAPCFWSREPSFATLLLIILEQQVSLASARATFERLQRIGPVSASSFLTLTSEGLRSIGFSRQKSRYGMVLAQAVAAGELDLAALRTQPNAAVRSVLTQLPGIGPWTAEVFLLTALRRADAWPVSDLGVIVGAQQVFEWAERPDREALDHVALDWRPLRGVATRLLWHNYLQGRSVVV